MNEATKARPRLERYLKGKITDIGCGPDPITPTAKAWDQEDGDAQKMENILDEEYDTVFSSHCLEHLRNPLEAVLNWWRILKPGGHLIVIMPDEDLYEQHEWPSSFNDDHKNTFTPHKNGSWSPASTNVLDIIKHLFHHKLISLQIIDTNYEYGIERRDQSQGEVEAAIEVILYKQVTADGIWNTSFEHAIFCPECKASVIALGITQNKLIGRCTKCGAPVGMDLKKSFG